MSAAIEQRAREEAETLPLESLAVELRTRLGVLLVAYIAGAHGTESVNQWALGIQTPSPPAIERLRLAHQISTIAGERHSPPVIQAWMQGLNPDLNDLSPARLLRNGDTADTSSQLLRAARSFVRN